MAQHDLIIRGGTVVDGTGATRRTADVAVNDGVISEVGHLSGSTRREIDADGALVAPGFVDIHAHYDGQATWDERMQPSSWHGVTTVVFGNCGVGFAPVHDQDHDKLVELMEGVEDIPGAALHEGLQWGWNSFGEYLDALEGPKDMNIAAQVPHGALRLHVMGERGANREDATDQDIATMGRLAAEGIAAGGLGFTTSRTSNHKTSTGDFTPTLTAAARELIGIAEAVGRLNTGVFQLVSDFSDRDAEFQIFRDMCEVSGRPLSFTLVESPRSAGFHHDLLNRIETARADGLEITGQCPVRPIGILLGFECTLNPFMRNPVWGEVADMAPAQRVAALGDPDRRQRLLQASGGVERDLVGGRIIEDFHNMFEMGEWPYYEPPPDQTVSRRAEASGVSPAEFALDLLLKHGGTNMLWLPLTNYGFMNLDGTRELLTHEHTVPALGDGGAHVGTICDSSFPTTLLQHWGRDRPNNKIDLEFLVQRQALDTARTVGLRDRGVLAPGYRADLNVIDFDNLRVRGPELAYDLPAGGRRVLQRADGYLHTIVGGEETYASGEATGALPGRLVRGEQSAPAMARPHMATGGATNGKGR
ncbi:MAG: amidohydrolase family protein [Acidimicrobiaceae bacterium]|nr:amidohydrolase family protein [Acidimicrobiaceae bacterium]MYD06830.1 amidohydrolase family protein [Acidimicrobiaceae bacterium]MYI57963.1 amidohydrolase family protein [Acidimicrobiaceae bacterium]